MNNLLNNSTYSDALDGNTRDMGADIDADVNVGVEVGADEGGEIMENLDGPNSNNFEAHHFGGDEWMKQLQQQQEDLIEQDDDAPLNSTQQQQFRLPFDHSMQLPSQVSENSGSVGDNNSDNSTNSIGPQHQMNQRRQSQDTDQSQVQKSQGLSQDQWNNTLQQTQIESSILAMNGLIQQQQQYTTHATNTTLGTMQMIEQQMGTRQQEHQLQSNSQSQQEVQQQIAAPNLRESLIQLQKLQEQQQQILKNIGHAGLIDPNALMNPIGSLLNTLIGQLNNNSNSNNGGNNNNLNNAVLLSMGQMQGIQQLQINNNSLRNPAAIVQGLGTQMLPQQVSSVGTNGVVQGNPHHQLKNNSFVENQQLANTDSSIVENNASHTPTVHPAIRKAEKKQKPNPFPKQLWDAMMADGPSNDDAFEWLPDGKSFVVVNPDLFCTEVLDRKFKQSKYGSFVRKLHRWGFIRLTSGTGTDCFHHPLFQRHKPEFVSRIKCNSRNGRKEKGQNPYTRGDILHSAQPSLMGVEKFIRAKVVSPDTAEVL